MLGALAAEQLGLSGPPGPPAQPDPPAPKAPPAPPAQVQPTPRKPVVPPALQARDVQRAASPAPVRSPPQPAGDAPAHATPRELHHRGFSSVIVSAAQPWHPCAIYGSGGTSVSIHAAQSRPRADERKTISVLRPDVSEAAKAAQQGRPAFSQPVSFSGLVRHASPVSPRRPLAQPNQQVLPPRASHRQPSPMVMGQRRLAASPPVKQPSYGGATAPQPQLTRVTPRRVSHA